MSLYDQLFDESQHPRLGDEICWTEKIEGQPEETKTVLSILERSTIEYCGWVVPSFLVTVLGFGETDIVYSAKRQRWEHPDVIEAYDGGKFKW